MQTNLQPDHIFNNACLNVFNFIGQPLNEVTSRRGELFTLFRKHLPAGVYFIRIMEDKVVIAADKLVIVD